jgi:hypothetical protein
MLSSSLRLPREHVKKWGGIEFSGRYIQKQHLMSKQTGEEVGFWPAEGVGGDGFDLVGQRKSFCAWIDDGDAAQLQIFQRMADGRGYAGGIGSFDFPAEERVAAPEDQIHFG